MWGSLQNALWLSGGGICKCPKVTRVSSRLNPRCRLQIGRPTLVIAFSHWVLLLHVILSPQQWARQVTWPQPVILFYGYWSYIIENMWNTIFITVDNIYLYLYRFVCGTTTYKMKTTLLGSGLTLIICPCEMKCLLNLWLYYWWIYYP